MRSPILLLAALAAASFGAPADATAQEDEQAAFARVLDAWNARRDGIATLRVEVVADALRPKGYLNPHKEILNDPPEGDYPAEDHRFEKQAVQYLDLAGKRSRSELRGERFGPGDEYSPFRRIFVLNGREWIAFTPLDDRGRDYHKIEFESGTGPSRGRTGFETLSLPVLWIAGVFDREPSPVAFEPGPQASPKLFRSEGFVRRDGRRLLVVRQNADRPGRAEPAFWADPERGGAIAHYELMASGTGETIDLEHEERGDLGWIPVRWTATQMEPDGAPRLVEEAVLTEIKANPPLEDALFDVRPGKGQLVARLGEREREVGAYAGPDKPLTDPRVAENLTARGSWTPWIVSAAGIAIGALVLLVRSRRA